MREVIAATNAPAAIGPYSQGIVVEGRLVFTAGQIPIDAETGAIVGNDIAVQTRKALENLNQILLAAGSGMEHVIKTSVFLKDMNDFAQMNEVYAEFFKENPPARSAAEVARLPKDVLVLIECIALASPK